MPYAEAYAAQAAHVEEVLAARARGGGSADRVLLVEHDAVITVSRRAAAAGHVLVGVDQLRARGVALEPTDRGGDVTYHGPGQLVAYPIIDLERRGLGIHAYVRALERAIIDTLSAFGLEAWRDQGATGVWIGEPPGAKVAAIGVRVRKWVTMHGLAINVDPDMAHFDLIVPCGLTGRRVTSLREQLGSVCPSIDTVAGVLIPALKRALAPPSPG